MAILGTVRELWRFPFKSMGGERLAAVEMFELEELDTARARFEELRGSKS